MGVESLKRFGELLFHKEVHKEVVSAVIFKNDKLLLVRRAVHERLSGVYELPGGTVNKGETHEEALIREVFQETGFRIISIHELVSIIDFFSQPHVHARSFAYMIETEDTEVVLSEEHDDYNFVELQEALQLPLSGNARHTILALLKQSEAR